MISRTVLAVLVLCGFGLGGCIVSEKVAGENWGGPAQSNPARAFTSTKAALARVEGHAVLVCAQAPEGRVTGCRVATETPPAYGFADSARRMADQLIIRSQQVPVGETVVVPLDFCPDKKQLAACQARGAGLAETVRKSIG